MIYYIVEVDYEWREISTRTTDIQLNSLEAVKRYIEDIKRAGRYEGHRVYEVSKKRIEV